MELGEKILNYRKQNNYTQEELAFKLGLTRQTISKWELNETSPDLKQAIKLVQVFNISLDELINYNGKLEELKNVRNNKILMVIIVCILIFLMEIVAISFYKLGTKKTNLTSTINVTCKLDNKLYNYNVTYLVNTYKVVNNGGSKYIFDNINELDNIKDKSVTTVITSVTKYFLEHNGKCE